MRIIYLIIFIFFSQNIEFSVYLKHLFQNNSKLVFDSELPFWKANRLDLNPIKNTKQQDSSEYKTIFESIAKQEYHITLDSKTNTYQAPNRQHNIRGYFEPGLFCMKNRVDSTGYNWNLSLKTIDVLADETSLITENSESSIQVNGNKIDINQPQYTEQYINSELGIRQNFIIQKAPENTKQITIKLQANGLKAKKVSEYEINFTKQLQNSEEITLTYNDLKVWDAENKPLEAHFEQDNQTIEIVVNSQTAKYPITIDPIVNFGVNLVESNQASSMLAVL